MGRLLAALLSLWLPTLTLAHELWVERTEGGFVARRGHRGGELLPIDGSQVKAIRCGDAAGRDSELVRAAAFSGGEIRFAAACAVVTVLLDGGYWSLTPDGEVNLPKTAARGAVRSWASRQWAKWVDARSPRARTVLGDELELVPASDLAAARDGDKVTLRVLSRGQPVRDAVVAGGHRPLGETDSRGEIRLRVRGTGTQSFSTSLRRPLATPEAETEVLEASLTFELAR